MTLKKDKIYCSLDIETSGFDPLKNEVLEIGFVFFEFDTKPDTKNGTGAKPARIKIAKEYSRVFKPHGEVPANILGLTGIRQAELDNAEPFSEHRDELQELLKDAVIVGHNIAFDIKFLQGFGIKFSGESIDTLDLVQWLLPTHHSYNLENLMHTFGIEHKDAHRALADSKATLKLLEKLLQLYRGLPDKLKKQIASFIEPYNFTWSPLLDINLPAWSFPIISDRSREIAPKSGVFKLEGKRVYNFSLAADYVPWLALSLANQQAKSLLVIPKSRQVLELYRQKLVAKPIFLPEQTFNENKFESLIKQKNLSVEQIKFILKVLVWRQTNWQTETFMDLNLSFFGGQFKELISGGELNGQEAEGLIACDQEVFLQLSSLGYYTKRKTVICGLNEFERIITADMGSKVSWGYINYLLKSYFDPEGGFGLEKYAVTVSQALADGDLFFGLASALLQTNPPTFQYYKISEQSEYDEKYQKIKNSAENYTVKLAKHNKVFKSAIIEKFILNLEDFFTQQENRVKWIELAENRCAFLSMPLDIKDLVGKTLRPFVSISFADSLDNAVVTDFFIARLGLEDFDRGTVEFIGSKRKALPAKQGDLFSGEKKSLAKKQAGITFHCLAAGATQDKLRELISDADVLPAAILFAGQVQVREFYDQTYQELKSFASLLVQNNSGGSNKIFRNFSIHKNSLLLCTDKFILKHLAAQNPVEPVGKLAVKRLIVCRLPFDQFTHPYQEALGKTLNNAFNDYALPKALLNFHEVLKFFYTDELEDIYVIDQKLDKPYALVFKDYYKTLPGAKLAE
ncbi:MAG: exonuclease domain-containing protein [Candidatus Doudnabacteria bacterium]|nr:exonuclease domain-containing protein [Candidatus Doudnabacteria bacterium]